MTDRNDGLPTPIGEPHDFGAIRAAIEATAARAERRYFGHRFRPDPDSWDGHRYHCRDCGLTREEHDPSC